LRYTHEAGYFPPCTYLGYNIPLILDP